MKGTVIVCLTLCCAISTLGQQYTGRFDSINVDGVLTNNRILQNYIKCLLGSGPCTQEGRELKKLLPEALETNCAKCTPIQRKNLVKIFKFFETNENKDWKKLSARYDPKGTYLANFRRTHS